MSFADDPLSAFINFDVCSDASSEPAYEPAKAEEPVLHPHHDLNSSLLYDSWPQFFDIINPCLLSSECSARVSWDPALLPESPVIRSSQSLLFSVDPTTIYLPTCLRSPSPPPSEESMPDLTSDSDSTYSSPRSSPFSTASSFASDLEEEWSSSSPFFDSSAILEPEEEGRNSKTANLPSSPLACMTPTTEDSPQPSLPILLSPSSSSSASSSNLDFQGNPEDQDTGHIEQVSLVNRTKVKLQRNRREARRMRSSSPTSCKSTRSKEHNQDAASSESSSSESVKTSGCRGRANRYACDACGQTFARRADIPRHMQSACSVIGKAYLPTCNSCGKTYSRLDAIRRHQRNGDCIESLEPPRRSGRRS